jgi:hypothetical protein
LINRLPINSLLLAPDVGSLLSIQIVQRRQPTEIRWLARDELSGPLNGAGSRVLEINRLAGRDRQLWTQFAN